jgi:hypothetical protein
MMYRMFGLFVPAADAKANSASGPHAKEESASILRREMDSIMLFIIHTPGRRANFSLRNDGSERWVKGNLYASEEKRRIECCNPAVDRTWRANHVRPANTTAARKKLRLLLILTGFPPAFGGMQTLAVHLCRHLHQLGYHAEVATYRGPEVESPSPSSGSAQTRICRGAWSAKI